MGYTEIPTRHKPCTELQALFVTRTKSPEHLPTDKQFSLANNPSVVRFEVFSVRTMKNVVFWDIKTSSYLTGDMSPPQSSID
jgi:hypothetical protein